MNHPAGSQVPGGAELPVQGRAGVLQGEGGGPADERDRDRLGRGHGAPRWRPRHGCLCWRDHCGTSMITRARRISLCAFPGGYPDLVPDFYPARPFPLT